MRSKLATLLSIASIAAAVAACNLMPFFPSSVDEPGHSPGSTSPTTPATKFSLPPPPAESGPGFPSPTIEIPPPID